MPKEDKGAYELKFLAPTFQKRILDRLVKHAQSLVEAGDKALVYVAAGAFYEAMEEADRDLDFMSQRRGLDSGVSEGKFAGVIYWRLTRHRVIYLNEKIVEVESYRHLQEKVMIYIVGSLLRVDFQDPWLIAMAGQSRKGTKLPLQNVYKELLYISARRHYNQESLALFFDTFVFLAESLKLLKQKKIVEGIEVGETEPHLGPVARDEQTRD